MLSDIFMFKNSKECNNMFRIIEPSKNAKISKDSFKDLRWSEVADLI
jgi:hypothetical protein